MNEAHRPAMRSALGTTRPTWRTAVRRFQLPYPTGGKAARRFCVRFRQRRRGAVAPSLPNDYFAATAFQTLMSSKKPL